MHIHTSSTPANDCAVFINELLKDKNPTLLLWSGGSAANVANELLPFLKKENDLSWLTMSLVDERYGKPGHDDSNEKLIHDTGIIDLVESKGGSWQPILTGKTIEETTLTSSQFLSDKCQTDKVIAIFGVGEDGHTAGMLPIFDNEKEFNQLFQPDNQQLYSSYDVTQLNPEYPNPFKQRVTLNVHGMKKVDQQIVFATGEKKREVLQKTQDESVGIFRCPARLLDLPKTQVFTDQKI